MFEDATPYQKQALNILYQRAVQEGYDANNLISIVSFPLLLRGETFDCTMEEKENTTEENPNMTKMLLEYSRQTKPSDEKDFYNTTMQLNRNDSVRLHVDKNNHGPPCIIAFERIRGWQAVVLD